MAGCKRWRSMPAAPYRPAIRWVPCGWPAMSTSRRARATTSRSGRRLGFRPDHRRGQATVTGGALGLRRIRSRSARPGAGAVTEGPHGGADGGRRLTGRFDVVEPNFLFLGAVPSYGAQGLSLRLDRNATPFASVARTPNERRVAAALETLEAGTPLYESVLGLASAEQASGAFRQLAGEIYPATQAALMRESRLLRGPSSRSNARGWGRTASLGSAAGGMEPGRQRRRGRWLPQPRHRLLGGRRRQPDADAARGAGVGLRTQPGARRE